MSRPWNRLFERVGFTLIELLVVIATLSVLLLISLGVINTIVGKHQHAVCAFQLHQIHTMIGVYLAENNHLYPNSINVDPSSGRVRWNKKIPVAGNEDENDAWVKTCICPLNRSSGIDPETGVPGRPYVVNYNILTPTKPGTNPLSLYPRTNALRIQEPAKIILMLDSKNNGFGPGFNHLASGWNRVEGRHAGKANILWVDGHVTSQRLEEITNQNIIPVGFQKMY
ncbi:MAG TPA: prepilin-type N-terminal cleavage/methylation domain-containing protein [Chthoniobacteraceae bacterium]|nr:prepilin-type N-terminal cleavage/methylation domain-containing protein [Chthoniobacteraceae bacterium]